MKEKNKALERILDQKSATLAIQHARVNQAKRLVQIKGSHLEKQISTYPDKYRTLYKAIDSYKDEASANIRRTTHLTELEKQQEKVQHKIQETIPTNYLQEAEIQADTAKTINQAFKKPKED